MSENKTREHIIQVSKHLNMIIIELLKRSENHDQSKLKGIEKDYFDIYTPKLKSVTYGSEQYKQYLKELKPAIDNHYKLNRHHPEHYNNGINDMNLVDLIEMLMDWWASSMRHSDGDIYKSIEINKERFNIDNQMTTILKNTIDYFKQNH